MRLRSGMRFGSEADEPGMEDNHSTQAEWGTPQTTSFSTTESHPPSVSLPEAGPSGSVQHQSFGQHYYPPNLGANMDFILYGIAGEEEYADGRAAQEQMPGQQQQSAQMPDPQQLQPLQPFSSYPVTSQPSFPQNGHTPPPSYHHGNGNHPPPLQAPQTMGLPQVDDADVVGQWPQPAPWSPISAAEANPDHLSDMRTSNPTYPEQSDKLQGELDALGTGAGTGSDEDEGDQKRRRLRKGKKRRRYRSGSRGRERDKRGRGGGGGNGHGIRAS